MSKKYTFDPNTCIVFLNCYTNIITETFSIIRWVELIAESSKVFSPKILVENEGNLFFAKIIFEKNENKRK